MTIRTLIRDVWQVCQVWVYVHVKDQLRALLNTTTPQRQQHSNHGGRIKRTMSYQQGKGRLYPRYSLNSSDNEDTPIHRSIYAQPYNSQQPQQQQTQQSNLPIILGGGGASLGLQSNSCYSYRSSGKNSSGIGSGHQQSQQQQQQQHQQITTPSSDNGSSATLTDAEAALARENTLLVNNGKGPFSGGQPTRFIKIPHYQFWRGIYLQLVQPGAIG